ncbi:SIR2 family protein [Aeromonas sobria]|uniref:SIR2 family protein n=1 Tax=Aeromonas sobria TaxID=646 RepID=UPI003F2BC950
MSVKPQGHLINILQSTRDHHPNFTLFLGAGASITSGIKSASGMINEWRDCYTKMYSKDQLHKQSWFDKPAEYSELFETLYDQPTQRREYIEKCIVDSKPSWGYIYLSNLLQKKHFNTIFTTNFDDLANESCYLYSSRLRPVVCAHDSSIKNIRLTSHRPKIIKLHGDFLFDNIKNTARELESLEDNMRSKFRQYATEFGMIVIGYAGNDRSIMDTLNTLLHSGNAFPHGVYWCIRGDEKNLSEDVKNLTRFPRFHLVNIDGFDEFMAELHHALGCDLQVEIADPYVALSTRLDSSSLIGDEDEDNKITSPIINNDIAKLTESIKKIASAYDIINKIEEFMKQQGNCDELSDNIRQLLADIQLVNVNSSYGPSLLPKIMLADISYYEGNFDESLRMSKEYIVTNDKNAYGIFAYLRAAIKLNSESDINQALLILKKSKTIDNTVIKKLVSLIVDVLNDRAYDIADKICKAITTLPLPEESKLIISINEALILRLKEVVLNDEQILRIKNSQRTSIEEDNWWLALGCTILINEFEHLPTILENLDDGQLIECMTKTMPIFTLLTPEADQLIESEALKREITLSDEDSTNEQGLDESPQQTSHNTISANQETLVLSAPPKKARVNATSKLHEKSDNAA